MTSTAATVGWHWPLEADRLHELEDPAPVAVAASRALSEPKRTALSLRGDWNSHWSQEDQVLIARLRDARLMNSQWLVMRRLGAPT